MLTRAGHGLLLRSIMGTLPSAVTHMSFGINYNDGISDVTNIYERESMGFEVLRVPIQTSYDHLTPLNVDASKKEDFQLVYKGELPINRRVLFNEIGLWQGGYNSRYGDSDSKLLSTCDINSGWKKTIERTNTAISNTPVINEQVMTDNDFFSVIREEYYANRVFRLAQPRIESTAIKLKFPFLDYEGVSEYYIYKLPLNIDLSAYNPLDKLKLAFTWVPDATVGSSFLTTTETITTSHKVIVDFAFANTTQSITKELSFDTVWSGDKGTIKSYVVMEIPFNELVVAENGRLRSIAVRLDFTEYGYNPGSSSLLLDGIRIDRATTNNPLYGLVFYDKIFDETTINGVVSELPVEKLSGFDGHIEHRVRLFAENTGNRGV